MASRLNKETPGKHDSASLKEAFNEFLSAYEIKNKYLEAELITSWGKLMGAPIAKRTQRVFIKDKKLFVELNSAPLKHELTYSKAKIIAIFNKAFEENIVEDIIFL